ncbi:MAG: XRE family transcriptional regulator [Peptococcaceae bacterium]|nr:XRE family transcriptional regulator [Peptococcaceae bacterium]
MREERRDLAWYYGEEIGGRLWRALARQLANRKTQLGVDEDALALEDVQVWAELGAPEVFSVLDLALSAQDAALRVRARVDLTSASFPVQVEVVARTEDAKEMQDYAAYFCEKGLVRLSAGLVPELGEDDLDALAERLLAAYYPEALEKPRRVDAHEMAERMGLSVVYRQIEPEGEIYGEMFFQETETPLYDAMRQHQVLAPVERKTMVVDTTATFMCGMGTHDNTIVHECVHWALHGQAMALRRAQQPDSQEPAICCRVDGGAGRAGDDRLLEMEWQANTLARCIQMPRALFRRKAEEAWARHDMKVITPNRVEEMPGVIDDLAGFFGVSREAAKLRMLEVGFESVAGVYVYIDGRYLRPHSWRAGALGRDETFSIPAEDAARLMVEDADFARAAQGYLYVEGHFVLDDPRYVTRSEDGALMLSDAARYHMDQCCLRFKVVLGGAQARYGEFCLLSQSAGIPLTKEYLFRDLDNRSEKWQRGLVNREKMIIKLIRELPNGFTEAFRLAINRFGCSQNKIAERTGYSPASVGQIINQKTHGTVGKVVAMCLAANLPPEISLPLLHKGGYYLEPNNLTHCIYHLVLKQRSDLPFDDNKKFLEEHGAPLPPPQSKDY